MEKRARSDTSIIAFGILIATAIAILFFVDEGLSLGFGFIAIWAWLGYRLFYTHDKSNNKIAFHKDYWYAFFIIIILTYVFYGLLLGANWNGHPGLYYDDEFIYDQSGWIMAENWHSGITVPVEILGVNNFTNVLGAIYYVFGHQQILVREFNAITGLWIAAATAGICRIVFPKNPKVLRYAFWLVALSPVVIAYSTSLLRDIQVGMGYVVCVWAILTFSKYRRISHIVIGIGAFVWVWYMRPFSGAYLLILICAGVMFWGGLILFQSKTLGKKLLILLMCIFILIGLAITQDQWIQALSDSLEKNIRDSSLSLEVSGTTFTNSFVSGQSVNFVNLAVATGNALLSPNPFTPLTILDFNSLVQFPVAVTWYILLPFWAIGAIEALKQKNVAVLLILIVTSGVLALSIYVLFTGYVDAVRTRAPVLAFILLLSAYGIYVVKDDPARHGIRAMIGVFFLGELMLGIVYLSFKMNGPIGILIFLAIAIALFSLAVFTKRVGLSKFN